MGRSRVILVLASLVLSGCLPFLKPTWEPMRTLDVGGSRGSGSCLAVLLPGRWGGPEDFVRAGFGRRVADRGLDLDLVAVDAHLGYYRERSILDRLREDVIEPARAEGYEEIWVVGASLGGLGSLLYLERHPDQVTGVLSLAPYLGDAEVLAQVRAAGGPGRYRPDRADDFRRLWSWLGRQVSGSEPPPIHLAYGTADDFAPAVRMLAAALPSSHTVAGPGGHDWKVWSRLWGEFLDQGVICSPLGAAPEAAVERSP